jgi:hypothetical protein
VLIGKLSTIHMNTPAEPVRANSVAKGLITLAIKKVRTPVEGQCSCSVIPLSVQLYDILKTDDGNCQ